MKLLIGNGKCVYSLVCMLCSVVSLGQTIPVWYSSGDVDSKALDSQYRRPIRTFDGKDLVLRRNSGTISVTTCAQYLDSIRRGYSAMDNFQNKKEAAFVETCFGIEYAKQARPSKVSYFPGPALPANLLETFPPIIQTGVAGTELNEDESWRGQDPTLVLTKSSPRDATLEDDNYDYSLLVDLAGDLNGDGVEDIAGFACMNAKQGTLLFCKTFAVTRCGPDRPITLISEPTAPYSISASKTCAKEPSKRPARP